MSKARGLELLQRYADGEQLSSAEMETLRSTMFMIRQTYFPPRSWASFHSLSVEGFMRDLWPHVRERLEFQTGLFEDGRVKP